MKPTYSTCAKKKKISITSLTSYLLLAGSIGAFNAAMIFYSLGAADAHAAKDHTEIKAKDGFIITVRKEKCNNCSRTKRQL